MEKNLKEILNNLGEEVNIRKEKNSMVLSMKNIEFDIFFSIFFDFFKRFESLKKDISTFEKPRLFFEEISKMELNMGNFAKEKNVKTNPTDLIMKYYGDLLPKDFEEKLNEFNKKNSDHRKEEINIDDIINFIPTFGNIYSQQKKLNHYKETKLINIEIFNYSINEKDMEFFNAILCFFLKIFDSVNNGIQIIEFEGGVHVFFNISILELIKILQEKVEKILIKNNLEYKSSKILKFYEMDFI